MLRTSRTNSPASLMTRLQQHRRQRVIIAGQNQETHEEKPPKPSTYTTTIIDGVPIHKIVNF